MRFFKIDQFLHFLKLQTFLFQKLPGAQFLDPVKGYFWGILGGEG